MFFFAFPDRLSQRVGFILSSRSDFETRQSVGNFVTSGKISSFKFYRQLQLKYLHEQAPPLFGLDCKQSQSHTVTTARFKQPSYRSMLHILSDYLSVRIAAALSFGSSDWIFNYYLQWFAANIGSAASSLACLN